MHFNIVRNLYIYIYIYILYKGGWKNRHLVDKSTIHPMFNDNPPQPYDDEYTGREAKGDNKIRSMDSVPLTGL